MSSLMLVDLSECIVSSEGTFGTGDMFTEAHPDCDNELCQTPQHIKLISLVLINDVTGDTHTIVIPTNSPLGQALLSGDLSYELQRMFDVDNNEI